MTTWTELYSSAESIDRKWYLNTSTTGASVYTAVAPVNAKCCIISACGAGGWRDLSLGPESQYGGGGAAFAKTKLLDITGGETFSVQVGSPRGTSVEGNSQGDSVVTRNASSAVVCKAARGTGIIVHNPSQGIYNGCAPGLAEDCIGDIKRSGTHGTNIMRPPAMTLAVGLRGGNSGGDSDDIYNVGFGGRGVYVGVGAPTTQQYGRYPAAGYGGGGCRFYASLQNIYNTPMYKLLPGAGRVCIEWFTKDPMVI